MIKGAMKEEKKKKSKLWQYSTSIGIQNIKSIINDLVGT